MLQTPPPSAARVLPSPEKLGVQMRYMERRYDEVLGKVLEQNALILKSVSRMQDDLKSLRTKLESLEVSAAQDEVITSNNNSKVNGVDGTDSRLNNNLQGQNGVGCHIHSPVPNSAGSSLASPFQQQQPYYNPYPHPMYNPYMMPMSDPMSYFVNPTMQYAAMLSALGGSVVPNPGVTTPIVPPPTELPKSTPPPFSFGVQLATKEEESSSPALSNKQTTGIFSQTPKNSPVVSTPILSTPTASMPIVSKPLVEKVEVKKEDKTPKEADKKEPDFAALSSKMCGFGDLNKTTSVTSTPPNPFSSFTFGSGSVQQVFSSPSTTNSTLNSSSNASRSPAGPQAGPPLAPAGDADEVADDFVPTAEFAPVIPLPPLVEVKKGDENENVLFQHRAKLLRFVKETMEWKERGVGDIKILQSKAEARKIRVVMWREKVHKIACNHWVTKDLEVTKHQGHPKNLTWTALDFAEAEEGPKTEIFVCRFGQEEQANEFKKQIELAISIVSQSGSPEKTTTKTPEPEKLVKPFAELFKKPDGQWNCDGCYTHNDKDKVVCVACGSSKPGSSSSPAVQESEHKGPHDPPCRGCDPDTFDFSVLEGREVPTFEDLPKPQRPEDSTKNETLKELLTKNTTINNKANIPHTADPRVLAGSGDATKISSALSNFSFSLPVYPSTTAPAAVTTTTGGDAFKMNVPTFSFNPNFTFSKENMSSITTSNSIFGGGFSAIDSTVPSTVDGLNNLDENGDEDYEDEEDETMFLSDGHVFCRKGTNEDFQDMGEGQVKIVYDGEHYCARFNFLSDTDEIEHFVATETTVTSTGDNTFEWDFINLTGNENADKSRIRVVFPDQQAFDSFASTMSDSVDMAMQAGVTESDLRDEAAQHD